jgi:charged multivesicular body protein 6
MGNLFKRKKKPEPSRIKEEDKAIAQLKITRDKIKSYQRKLEGNIKSCKEAVKLCIQNKRRDQAMLSLRKQKYLEKTLEGTHGELLNIESLILNVENAQMQAQVVKALAKGNEILTKMNKELNIEDVEKLMAETDEAIEYQNQIGQILSQQGVPESQDLLDELDSLDVEKIDLPDVPTYKLQSKRRDVEEKEERKEIVYA